MDHFFFCVTLDTDRAVCQLYPLTFVVLVFFFFVIFSLMHLTEAIFVIFL
jgi:hypothetical protein